MIHSKKDKDNESHIDAILFFPFSKIIHDLFVM